MDKLEYILENKTHKILLGFEIQIGHLISARRSDPVIINKKKKRENFPVSGLCCPSGAQSENKCKLKERQIIEPCHKTKIAVEHQGDAENNCNRRVRKGG